MSNNYTTAFLQGCEARENGWERISPYKMLVAEAYWLAGYDGHSFDTAQHNEMSLRKNFKWPVHEQDAQYLARSKDR